MSAAVPMSVLDEIESGLVVLDKDFQARFINRAVYKIWALPELSNGSTYNFADIVEHGRRTGLYLRAAKKKPREVAGLKSGEN